VDEPISVLLVDDHAVVREGYRRLLEWASGIRVVGEAANGPDAVRMNQSLRPDVVVMDLAMPGVSGLDAMRRILAHAPQARVLIFSMHEEPIFAERALDGGAYGYVTKSSAGDVLVEAVRAVARGERFVRHPPVDPAVTTDQANVVAQLSARELEVLQLLAQGFGLDQIGVRLGVSAKTVANYQSLIRQKLGADNALQLIQVARRLGIVFGAQEAKL